MRWRWGVVLASCSLLCRLTAGDSFAEDGRRAGRTPANDSPHVAIAMARARTTLLREVRRLPLGDRRTVADWAARDPQVDRDLRRWLRSRPPVGGVQRYSDGSCEVNVRVRPQELVDWFRGRSRRARVAADSGLADDAALETAARNWPVVWGRGWSVAGESVGEDCPPGWEDVEPDGVSAARAAAREAAQRRLVAEVEATPLAGAWAVRALTGSDAAIHQALLEELRRAASTHVSITSEQLAVARASISRGELVRLLSDLYDRYYLGEQLARGDIQELMLRPGASRFEAVAAVPPPDSAHTAPAPPTSAILREIATSDLAAIGRSTAGCGVPLPASVVAALARADAINTLRRRIADIEISGGVTVDRWLEADPLLRTDVETLVRGARVAVEHVFGAAAIVRVEVSGATLARLLDAARGRRAASRPARP